MNLKSPLGILPCAALVLASLAVPAHATSRLYVVSGSTLTELDPLTAATIGSIAITPATGTVGALAWDSATNTVFLSSTGQDNLWTLDPTTGVATLVGLFNVGSAVVMHGLEVDDTGQLYGYSSSVASGTHFFSINRTTGQATPLPDPGIGNFGSLGYVAATSTMYLADLSNDRILTVDRVTGATTVVGPVGLVGQVGIGMAYDPVLGMYACDNTAGNGLYKIDLATGAATLVGNLAPSNPLALTFVGLSNTPSTPLCFGDGTDAPCPCTNVGLAGRGCENTFATGGAKLASSGTASIAADTLVLNSTFAVPFGPGLYYEGSTTANPVAPFGVAFGNGLRCAGGATNRLEIRFADGAGAASTTVSLGAFGAAVAGNTYYYQLWYRDTGDVGTCMPGAGFNFSGALSLAWSP